MAEVFLTGKLVNVYVDRDTAFSITMPPSNGVALSSPVLEVERIRTTGFTAVASALVPTAAIVNGALKASWTAEQGGLLQDLVSAKSVARFRYRLRASANGAAVRTFVAGKIHVGPIGFASGSENLVIPVRVLTGDIVVGDVTVVDGPPDEGEETLADVVEWETDFVEAWATDVYTQWA